MNEYGEEIFSSTKWKSVGLVEIFLIKWNIESMVEIFSENLTEHASLLGSSEARDCLHIHMHN